ncbi:MAG TPA: hypothetical protein VMD08_00260 [Candidatus Baltobacteraceae bacterium]|nr:hypothetical protein [Candidatus Baltobacteraceae bacterium]
MDGLRISAHGNDVTAHANEAGVLLCQSSEFGRSDKAEIGGGEEENRPAAFVDLLAHRKLAEFALGRLERGDLEIGYLLTQPYDVGLTKLLRWRVKEAGVLHPESTRESTKDSGDG